MMGDSSPPVASRCFTTTLIPLQETVSWKIQNVSDILRTNAWTALSIPMEVGLGPTELSRWSVSLQTRNDKSLLCARTMLLSPPELHRRVTHRMKVAVVGASEDGNPQSFYYFPNLTNSNNQTTHTSTKITLNPTNNDGERCMSFKKIKRLFSKNAKLDEEDQDEIGDGSTTKEARPGHKGHPTLWKIAPLDKIIPDEQDCIELRVTLMVYGCDVMEER